MWCGSCRYFDGRCLGSRSGLSGSRSRRAARWRSAGRSYRIRRGRTFRPGLDPGDEIGNLGGLECMTRRHLQLALATNRIDQDAGVGIARDNYRTAASAFENRRVTIETEPSRLGFRVAGVAIVVENGLNALSIEVGRSRCWRGLLRCLLSGDHSGNRQGDSCHDQDRRSCKYNLKSRWTSSLLHSNSPCRKVSGTG